MNENKSFSDIAPVDCPYYMVTRAGLMMTASLKRAFAKAGVPQVRPSYLGVLWCLWKNNAQRTAELARCAGLEPSTMTGLLDRMERDGLVKRGPDPDDRRAVVITLTPSAMKVEKKLQRAIDDTLKKLLLGIEKDQLETLTEVLGQLLDNAWEDRDE